MLQSLGKLYPEHPRTEVWIRTCFEKVNHERRIVLFYILAKIFGRETYPDVSNTMGIGACVCVHTELCLHFALRSAKPRGATFVWGTLGVEYS